MLINIWAGIAPIILNTPKGINIIINSLHKPHPKGRFIHLVSDPRYIRSIDNKIIPNQNLEDILIIAASADNKMITKRFNNKLIYSLLGRDGFSSDISKGFYHGCSTVYIGIQTAIFLGAKEINIYGTKYSYGTGIERPNGLSSLPDPLISETQMVIDNYNKKIMEHNVKIKLIGTVL